jgi:glutathione-regulated potassium-efflux system ancillary protein KefC
VDHLDLFSRFQVGSSATIDFGTISALFGLNHGIIDESQYSHLVATVIGSAVIPTAIANARFMPHHLLPPKKQELKESAQGEPVRDIE